MILLARIYTKKSTFLNSLPSQYPLIPFCDPYFHDISDFYTISFRDEYFLPVASSPNPCLIFSLSGYEDLLCSADHEEVARLSRLSEDIVQDCPSSRLFPCGYIILEPIGRCCPCTGRVASDERNIELALSHRGRGRLELLLRLPREPDDDIRRDREEWISRPEVVDLRLEVSIGVLSVHFL